MALRTAIGFVCLYLSMVLTLHGLAAGDERATRNVLVINSYHPGYFWSDDIMEGIWSVLGEEDGLEVFIEYLDTKRHVDTTYFDHMREILLHKYDQTVVDVIITSDDNALDFMLGMRSEFQTGTPLIFCGIDHVDPTRILENEPVYGVVEGDGTRSTINLILSLHPGISTLHFVSDATRTGGVMLKAVRNMERSYEETVKFSYLVGMSASELKAALSTLPPESAVLYLSFIRDRSGRVLSIEESMELVAGASTAPVYCTWGFKPNTGVVGGSILSGFNQGEISAGIALRILRNEDVSSIPSAQKAPLAYMFDYEAMERFGISAKDVPQGSTILNKQVSIYSQYRWRIMGVAGLVILETLMVFLLLSSRAKHKRGEKALAESEERFRITFEQAAVGIAHVALDGRFLRINRRFCEIVGFSHEEMLERTFQDITHPDDLDSDLAQVQRLLERTADHYSMEKRHLRKSGEIVWVNLTVALLRRQTGEPRWFVAVAEDIDRRKRAEERIQLYQRRLRALASALTVTEERERRRIAADLHDHIGHSLALARMELESVTSAKSRTEMTGLVKDISHILLKASQDTRNLIHDLSSPSMDHLGLGAAISEWLEDHAGRKYGLQTEFADKTGDMTLDSDLRAVLFRSVRELLTNVIKHAKAGSVSVLLESSGGGLKIAIKDDGMGFDLGEVARVARREGGFGLFSIEERMTDLGGWLKVLSEPGKGCEVIMFVPLGPVSSGRGL